MSFRLGPHERLVLDDIAARLGVSRPDVVRLALRAFDEETRAGGGLRRAVGAGARSEGRAPTS